jgi:hypothetical protein
MDLQKQIEALKLQRIQEIIDDNNVSKIQKIKLFEKLLYTNGIFTIIKSGKIV